jgi:hypothetical protein
MGSLDEPLLAGVPGPDDTIRLLADASPRPWYFDGWDIFTTGPTDETGGHRLVVPLPNTVHPSQRVSKADAELIVLAVNEYERLVGERDHLREAAKVVVVSAHNYGFTDTGPLVVPRSSYESLKAAVSSAGTAEETGQ